MRYLTLLPLILLAGCGDVRGERTVWRGHPSIVLCANQDAIYAHAPGQLWVQPDGAWQTIKGVYERGSDTVYLLCANPDGLLTVEQALYLCHELQHRADARNAGSMWDLLQDESSPNGHAMGGVDFDQHHHKRVSKEGGN